MGFFTSGGRFLVDVSQKALKGAANALHDGKSYIASHEKDITRQSTSAVRLTAAAIKDSGAIVAAVAKSVSKNLHSRAAGSTNVVAKVAGHGIALAADAVAAVGLATTVTGILAERVAPAVGAAAGGAVRGTAEVVSGAVDSVAISADEIERMRKQLLACGERAKSRSEQQLVAIEAAQKAGNRKDLLDVLVVGGMTLAEAIRSPGDVPPDVQRAFQLAYPDLALHETFGQAVERMSPDELVGLTNGVKGKLFEIDLVDHLNHGGLPEGWHAELARAANQPAWDLRILDDHGQVADLVQAKATESAAYVKEALARYPGIDVTTTTEVHGQLLAMGMADHVHDGGITDAALDAKVAAAASMADGHLDLGDFIPSALGFGILGISAFMDKSLTLEQQGAQLGSRSAKAGISAGIGKAALVIGPYWWLGLVAGAGARWLASQGGNKRERYEALRAALMAVTRQEALPPAVSPGLLPAP